MRVPGWERVCRTGHGMARAVLAGSALRAGLGLESHIRAALGPGLLAQGSDAILPPIWRSGGHQTAAAARGLGLCPKAAAGTCCHKLKLTLSLEPEV